MDEPKEFCSDEEFLALLRNDPQARKEYIRKMAKLLTSAISNDLPCSTPSPRRLPEG